MNELQVGQQPADLTVRLTPGADLFATLRRDDGTSWQAGDTMWLEFVYGAGVPVDRVDLVLDGTDARLEIDALVIDQLISKRPRKVKLWYENGATRLLWALGKAVTTR